MPGFLLLPVAPWNFSVLDEEFNSIRDSFDTEMKKLEEEMSRFHREFSGYEQVTPGANSSESKGPLFKNWLDEMKSPLVQESESSDNKQLKLRFDVSQYKPEEITVKAQDDHIIVHAKHEEKGDGRYVHCEYNRQFLLPKGTDPATIKSTLSKDGVLTVEAPLPAITAGERLIPIEQKKE